MTNNNLTISAGGYTSKIDVNDITELKLLDELPDDSFLRTNGASTDSYDIGRYEGRTLGKCSLYVSTGRNSKVIVCHSDFFLYINQRKHADKHQDDTAGCYCTGDSCENPRAFFSIIKRVVAGLHAVFNENMFVVGIYVALYTGITGILPASSYYVYIFIQLIAVLGFIVPIYMGLNRKKELLSANTSPIDVDDDEYWKTGYYYNPDDKHILIENRMQTNTRMIQPAVIAQVIPVKIHAPFLA